MFTVRNSRYFLLSFLGLVFGFILLTSTTFGSLNTFAALRGSGYKMPFRSTEVWSTDQDYGVHTDSVGQGFDFYAPNGSTKDVLAISDGVLTRGCSANGSTRLRLDTNQGDIVRFFHVRADTVPIIEGEDVYVRQGDILGKVTEGGVFSTPNCRLSSDFAHLHFSWTTDECPMYLDNFGFSCENMKDCSGLGLYNTFCNRKYLGMSFNSSNIALDFNGDCNTVKSKGFEIGTKGLEIVRLQKCLVGDGLYKYAGGVSGYFGPYTQGIQNTWKASQQPASAPQPSVPQTTPANTCTPVLGQNYSIGQSGDNIRQLQQCLKDRGLFNWAGGNTGYFGNYTNGQYNQWLASGGDACSYLKGKNFPSGERSERVKRLQQCLREAGLFTYPSNTGLFGAITQEAFKKW
jgi:peptidoglycan hydrolase-like protein with peptidoglycan-binding domain